MGARNKRWPAVVCLLLASTAALAQTTETFAYTGDDARRSAANVHWVNFGGFANNVVLVDQELLFPYLPSLFYETGYLLLPANRTANVSLNVAPEIFLSTFFMGRVTGTAELVLINEATTRQEHGLGLRFGLGYSALGSTFDFTESTPLVRAGLLFGNIRVTYAYSFGQRAILSHQLGIGIKFDW
jgi:hypothetical protein